MSSAPVTSHYDRDLERRVLNYLGQRYLPGLRSLTVQADNGTVTLSGRVNSFYERQVAISSCQRVAGVRQLIDTVSVATTRSKIAAASG